MVYADGSNPSVRKDIGVRLPFPALTSQGRKLAGQAGSPCHWEKSTNGDFSVTYGTVDTDKSSNGDIFPPAKVPLHWPRTVKASKLPCG